MPTTTPLTDAITALTTYSNTVTGASDTDLSSAVATLAAGYGQGGGTGEDDLAAVLAGSFVGAFSNNKITKLHTRALIDNTQMTSISLPNLTRLEQRVFENCPNLEYFDFPELTTCGGWAFYGIGKNGSAIHLPKLASCDSNGMMEASKLGIVVLPVFTTLKIAAFNNSSLLTAVDTGATNIGHNVFANCNVLSTVILRSTSLVTLGNVTAFNNNTFKSGGTGGTIYIPKALYDHLGDGTSLDYKAATNWSTVDGYGTITWKAIEGSQYENYYADDTAIS